MIIFFTFALCFTESMETVVSCFPVTSLEITWGSEDRKGLWFSEKNKSKCELAREADFIKGIIWIFKFK